MGKNPVMPGFQMTIECYPRSRSPPLECKEADISLEIKTATIALEVLKNALDNSAATPSSGLKVNSKCSKLTKIKISQGMATENLDKPI